MFELEADATIPAEYVLLEHFLGEIDEALEQKIAVYLRAQRRAEHGGWPLFHGGDFNISASVKAYFALKAHRRRPGRAAHARAPARRSWPTAGRERSNVFTRTLLALFGEVPWHAVPVMPVEIMNLPRWFPFHLDKVSYWSRTVIVPLIVADGAEAPRPQPERRRTSRELFAHAARARARLADQADRSRLGPLLHQRSTACSAGSSPSSRSGRRDARDRARGRLDRPSG